LQEGDSLPALRRRMKKINFFFKRIFTYADVIQVISEELKDFARIYAPKAKVVVIQNGVDFEKFNISFTNPKVQEIRDKYRNIFSETRKDPNTIFKLIITTSRLVHKNGVDTLIDTMRYLPSGTHLLILGEGSEKNSLLKRVGDMGDRIHFLDTIDHDHLPYYIKACDVFSRLSRSEGFGLSFVEAMATGVPVVATSVGGILGFAKGEENSLLVHPDNPEEASHAIIRIFEDSELRKKIVAGGEETARERDWSIIATKMLELFKEIA